MYSIQIHPTNLPSPTSPRIALRRKSSSATLPTTKPKMLELRSSTPYIEEFSATIFNSLSRHRHTFWLSEVIDKALTTGKDQQHPFRFAMLQSMQICYQTPNEILLRMLKKIPPKAELIEFLKRYGWKKASEFCRDQGESGIQLMQNFDSCRTEYVDAIYRLINKVGHIAAARYGSISSFSDYDMGLTGEAHAQRQAILLSDRITNLLGMADTHFMWELHAYPRPDPELSLAGKKISTNVRTPRGLLIRTHVSQMASLLALRHSLHGEDWASYQHYLPQIPELPTLSLSAQQGVTRHTTLKAKIDEIYQELTSNLKKQVLITVVYQHLEDLALSIDAKEHLEGLRKEIQRLIESSKTLASVTYPLYQMADKAVANAYRGDYTQIIAILESIETTQQRSQSFGKQCSDEEKPPLTKSSIHIERSASFLDRLADAFTEKDPTIDISARVRLKEEFSALRVTSVEKFKILKMEEIKQLFSRTDMTKQRNKDLKKGLAEEELSKDLHHLLETLIQKQVINQKSIAAQDHERNQIYWYQAIENFLAQDALLSDLAYRWIVLKLQENDPSVKLTLGMIIDTARETGRFMLDRIQEAKPGPFEVYNIHDNRRLILDLSKNLLRAISVLHTHHATEFKQEDLEALLALKKYQMPKNLFFTKAKTLLGDLFATKILDNPEELLKNLPEEKKEPFQALLKLYREEGFVGVERDREIDLLAAKIGFNVTSANFAKEAKEKVLHLLIDAEKKFSHYSLNELADLPDSETGCFC